MKNDITIPSLGESITEVTIGQILTPSGTILKADAEILELETDKVNQVLYAPQAGKVHLIVKTGDRVKIGQTIGSIEPVQEKETPLAQTLPEKEPSLPPQSSQISPEKEKELIKEEPKPAKAEKKLLERETRRPMSKIRQVITKKLLEAQRTMAMLTTFQEIDLTQVTHLREKYKEAFLKKHGCRLGLMPFFIEATLSGLQAFPALNSYIDNNEIVQRNTYDIGIAVGTDRGVIVPVIRNCDQLSFPELEKVLEDLAKRARELTLTADELQGGGFTITNGGVYGSLLSTPSLLPTQCGILGMHKIEKRAIVIDDQITIRPMMYLALSYDHCLIDGKEAISFLIHLKEKLEDPSRLLIEI